MRSFINRKNQFNFLLSYLQEEKLRPYSRKFLRRILQTIKIFPILRLINIGNMYVDSFAFIHRRNILNIIKFILSTKEQALKFIVISPLWRIPNFVIFVRVCIDSFFHIHSSQKLIKFNLICHFRFHVVCVCVSRLKLKIYTW